MLSIFPWALSGFSLPSFPRPLPCFGEDVAWGDHTVFVAGPVVGAAEFANSLVDIPGWPAPTLALATITITTTTRT